MGFHQAEVLVARITRKELKSDKFALEVGQTVTFFEEHRDKIFRYGAIALGVAVLIVGWVYYQKHQRAAREEALATAISLQEASIGQPDTRGVNFQTQAAKDELTTKTFSSLATKYSGTTEGEVAQYYLGAIAADGSKMADAEKHFQEVAQHGNASFASLAKFSLAQIYFGDGRDAQGEAMLRDLIQNPTTLVSKDQATITLAHFLLIKRPAEARKLLDPLKTATGTVGRTALSLYGQLPPQ
jgi:predicted negative regulator of RcsB-dependent stress response